MKRWQLFCTVMTLTLLCACAAQQQAGAPSKPAVSMAKAPAISAGELPCAETGEAGSLQVRYPTESLYRSGAVFPKQEGLDCLDVLVDYLKGAPKVHWELTLSGEEGYGFDPLALAGKRQELLQRYFQRKGLVIKDWQWQTVNEPGLQLQLAEATGQP